jgi:hypothetical protein
MGSQAVRPQPQVAILDGIVGDWRTEGRVIGDGTEPDVPIRGTDRYHWLAGGHFLIHDIDVLVGDQAVVGIEVIGEYDASEDAFRALSFDNQGAVVLMFVRVDDDGVWTFSGGSDVAPAARPDSSAQADQVRSTLRIAADGTSMTAQWERSTDGVEWMPWMDIHFTRIEPAE